MVLVPFSGGIRLQMIHRMKRAQWRGRRTERINVRVAGNGTSSGVGMDHLQMGVFLAFIAIALLMTCAFMILHRREERAAHAQRQERRERDARLPENVFSGIADTAKKHYMEVWLCPHCNRLSRISHNCKWCSHSMPSHPKYMTVPEKDYIGQFSLPDTNQPSRPEESET